jgi:hypothetical protein
MASSRGWSAGSPFEISGVTLVSRDARGKIVKESIFYNLAHVQRYLGTLPVPA